MTEKLTKISVIAISLIFILANCYFITKEIYWGLLIPIGLVMGILYIYALDKVLLAISFLIPLAVNIDNLAFGVGISLPTEPMLILVMFLFILRLIYDFKYDPKIIRHPIFIAISIYMAWMFITCFSSEMPMVSFKYFLSQAWFIIPAYFMSTILFKKYENIKYFNRLYISGFIIVIIYTLIRHAQYGFAEQQGHWVMGPFYNDHTAYGAALAFFMPAVVFFTFNSSFSKKYRTISLMILALFIIATVFSYGRAAWISMLGSLGVACAIWLKIKFKYLFGSFASILILFFAFQHQIIDSLERNKQDSSANFVEHIRSISNISSDASNLERINRWQAALRLSEKKPFFGWGPGTYQFVYAPFQMSKEKTIISTNSGDQGNAHSEYLGPLSQMGIFGLLSFLSILIISLYKGINLYKKVDDKQVKGLVMVSVLGLTSYFINGVLNNFLDTDKLAFPFWSYLAILTAIEVYHKDTVHKSKLIPKKEV